jgi:hypothetical protein
MGLRETQIKTALALSVLFAMAIFLTVWRGYSFGVSDHAVHIPFIKHILDPTLYPNDPMILTAKKYVSYFPSFLSLLTRIFKDMEVIFFTIHLISVTLFLLVLYRLSLFLFEDRFSAALCLVLMLPRRLVLGKGAVYLAGMYPSFVMLPFGLLAVLLFLKGRRVAAFSVLGATANFHMLVSFYAFCMLSFCTIFEFLEEAYRRREIRWRETLIPISVYLVLASPVLIWSLRSYTPVTEEWVRLLRIRSSHHSFPFSWSRELFVNYLLLLSFFGLAFRYRPDAKTHRRIMLFCCAIAFLCLLGVIFAEWRPVSLILRAQLFRSTVYLTIFCILYISNYLRRLWNGSAFHRIAAALTFAAIFFPEYYPLAPAVLAMLLILEWREGDRRIGVLLFALGSVVLRIYVRHSQFPGSLTLDPIMKLLRVIFETRPLFLSVLIMLLSLWVGSLGRRRLKLGLSSLMIGFSLLYLAPTAFMRFHPPDRFKESWRDVQLWAKRNTPKDALFLTPPYREGFRIFSERGIVGDWKDGTQQYFDVKYSYEWWRRMQDLGGRGRGYDSLPEERYVEVARKYGASYLVVPAKRELTLEKVYGNKGYAVYRIP